MVKGYNFNEYVPVKHQEKCPSDDTDPFHLPDAIRYAEIEEDPSLMGMGDPAGDDDGPGGHDEF